MRLHIIIGSTRPGRAGKPVADWFLGRAKADGRFDVELVDLKDVALPLLDEVKHPRLQQYEHEHTKAWSRSVASADAFVFVTCEYNYGYPAALKNAIDTVLKEWAKKPIGFVSYGGVAGGTRAVQQLRQVIGALDAVDLTDAVHIPFVARQISEDRTMFAPTPQNEKAAEGLLDALAAWAAVLKPFRETAG